MARTTKQLSGAAKDKLLKGLALGIEGLSAGDATRVGARLTAAITEVRVRRDVWEVLRGAGEAGSKPALAKDVTSTVGLPATPTTAVTTVMHNTDPAAAAPVAPVVVKTGFDPYAFSAVALLTRQGEAALTAALDKVDSLDDLRALALAQHLALDPGLADVAAVRSALVAATARRIAERKAAAS